MVGDGMLSAYVLLIESKLGKVAHVALAMNLDGVQLAEDLAGPTTSSPGCRRPVSMSSAS